MAPDIPPVFMTVKEVAEYLQLSPSTVYKLVRQGKLPAFKIGGDFRFSKRHLEKWMANLSKPSRLPK